MLETPYKAKETALSILERRMYKETMTLNTEELTGGNLTNVAIKVAMTDFDLKVDQFEFQCVDFVQNILSLLGCDEEPKFKRRTLINDTEMLQNIYIMRQDIDQETALRLNPMIQDDEIEEILEAFAEEQLGANDEFESEEFEEDESFEDIEEVNENEEEEEEPNKKELDELFAEFDLMLKELGG